MDIVVPEVGNGTGIGDNFFVVEKLFDSKQIFIATELFTKVGGTWVSC